MGMSPQTGLPHNNRVGDFDPYALPLMMKHTGLGLEDLLKLLATEAGLLGLSGGLSGDVRDLESAAAAGNAKAQLAKVLRNLNLMVICPLPRWLYRWNRRHGAEKQSVAPIAPFVRFD